MSKRVKNVNRSEANKLIQEASNYRKVVPAYREALKSFNGLRSIDKIDAWLNEQTNFVNTKLSATAMGLEAEYDLVSKYLGKITLKNYDKNGLVTEQFKDKCFADCTVYYSDEDVKLFDEVEKVLDKLNALGLPNGCLRSDHNGQIHFNDKSFNLARQFRSSSRSFAEKQAKAKEVIDAVKKPNKSIVEKVSDGYAGTSADLSETN